jgi:hypothetical protein
MTEAELVSAAQAVWANVIAFIAIMLSILTAYLVVAYMAGSKMTHSQVVIVNGFYILVMMFLLWGSFVLGERAIEMGTLAIGMSTQRTLEPTPNVARAIVAIFGVCSLASLKFMWDVRHPKTE